MRAEFRTTALGLLRAAFAAPESWIEPTAGRYHVNIKLARQA
jgi:hypothetical protein